MAKSSATVMIQTFANHCIEDRNTGYEALTNQEFILSVMKTYETSKIVTFERSYWFIWLLSLPCALSNDSCIR